MTLDEAICHAEEVAEGYEEDISKWEYTLSEYRKRECVEQTTIPRCEKALNKCKQCVSEHRQLAEWLRDYKRLKEQEPCENAISREDALMALTGEWAEPTDELIHRFIKRIKNLPPVNSQVKTGHCKDCKYFEYDSVAKVDGIPLIVAHEICNKWGDGCKTREDGYCFLFEPKMSENPTGSEEGEDDETAD